MLEILTMKALRVFRGLMSFLTAIPLKMDEEFLELSARFMFLFPIIGALIRRVIEAAKASKRISETYVAVTAHNSQTAEEAAKASEKVIETEGQGYHADLRKAILKLNLTCPVLTISSDLPLLTGEFLDEIIDRYEKSRKPALTVLAPVEV